MNFTLITSAIAAACGFSLAWQLQAHQILKINLEAKDAVISQQRSSRAALERATGQVIAAQNAASVRNTVIRRDADRAGSSGNGLRLASTSAVRAAAADIDACTRSLDAHSVVLGEAVREAEWLAAEADQWASHAVMLQDGWPK